MATALLQAGGCVLHVVGLSSLGERPAGEVGLAQGLAEDTAPLRALAAVAPVAESARAHSYLFSKQVQNIGLFWLLTRWLLAFGC